ncbi:MAG TPA: amidohydrolase family protein [Acidimicrobiales bacterium]|nr:amidohydrolase family protein [Acidimicrobiales bacterium]
MSAGAPGDPLSAVGPQAPLVDHHCHGLVLGELSPQDFEGFLTEADQPGAPGSPLDTQLGVALRRWCAPVLDLEAGTGAGAYLERRAELGGEEVARRFLRAAGVAAFLVDTGYRAGDLSSPPDLARLAGAEALEVVRLEAVAEQVGAEGVAGARFADAVDAALDRARGSAVAFKTIVAYRGGLHIDPTRPTRAEVDRAASAWLAEAARAGRYRLDHPVLLRHLLWAGVERGLPLQVHVGLGDPDLRLHRCDPSLLTDFLLAVRPHGVPVVLLHCYPYHRQAAYLAAVLPHVHLDLGLALNHVGARAWAVVAETLELAPFHKVLFSSDAAGLAELFYLGATLFRRGLGRVLAEWVEAGDWTLADAHRVASLIAAGNARRCYHLAGP